MSQVFKVFLKWSDGVKSGLLSPEDISYLKEHLMRLDHAVLPTEQDKWVSLHPSFGLVCWCDDKKLWKQFKHFDKIDFLYFGELSEDEKQILQMKVSVLMKTIGIPALSEVRSLSLSLFGLLSGDVALELAVFHYCSFYCVQACTNHLLIPFKLLDLLCDIFWSLRFFL